MSKKSFKGKSFIVWLKNQTDRIDRTGMFARKLLDIPVVHRLKTITGIRFFVDALEKDEEISPVLSSENLERAYSEFKRQSK